MIRSINPTTGAVIADYPLHGPTEIEAALAGAAAAQAEWRRVPIVERMALLRTMARELRAGKEHFARLITEEMGKPVTEAAGEIEKCAVTCDFYAEAAPGFLADETIASNATDSGVVFDPLGVVLAVMPWNYPFWQVFRFAAPALAAGNGIILKHASNVPGCAGEIEALVRRAGCPEGLVRNLYIRGGDVGALIADDRIAAVTLTGSTEVGAIVASQAGAALKKQVLELGGSDAFIVLADADLEAAAATAVRARFINVGQSCVNAKRFIIEESVADRFAELFRQGIAALKIGDPMDPETQIGPMARANLRDDLHDQVRRSVAGGAEVVMGGEPLDGAGCYYAPTLLDRVEPGHVAFREELFGPVASIIRARDADHAIALANDSEFGLGAALWTADLGRARALSREIEAGAVFINGMVASDARLPFGGIKKSGYGRELGSYGIREFTNIKTSWISTRLGLGQDERAHKLRMTLSREAEVLASRTVYVPEHVAPSLQEAELTEPLHRLLEDRFGQVPVTAEETMRMIHADQLRATTLRIAPETPLILLERLVFVETGEPVEYARTYYRAEYYRFEHKLVRPEGGDKSEAALNGRRHRVGDPLAGQGPDPDLSEAARKLA